MTFDTCLISWLSNIAILPEAQRRTLFTAGVLLIDQWFLVFDLSGLKRLYLSLF